MSWKRARSDRAQTCTARGCSIAAGSEYWIKQWQTELGTTCLESFYCSRCGDSSRCATGIIKTGPAIIAALAVLSFIVLPVVWRAHPAVYVGVFAAAFVATAMFLTRTFFWLFRNSPQVHRADTWDWPTHSVNQTVSAAPVPRQQEASAGPSDP